MVSTPLPDGPVAARAVSSLVPWLVALVALLTLVYVFSPKYLFWRGLEVREALRHPEVNRASALLQQAADPLREVEGPVNRVLRWRLLFPSLAHATGIPPYLLLALPHLGCLVVLAFIADRLRRAGARFPAMLGLTLILGGGGWLFVSTGWLGYFDAWYLLALLIVAFVTNRTFLAAACLLGPWVDERFVLALPAAFAVRSLVLTGLDGEPPRPARVLLADAMLIALSLMPYLGLRLGVYLSGRDSGSAMYAKEHLELARSLLPATRMRGLWEGLRIGWLPALLLVAHAARGGWAAKAAGGTILLTALGSSFIAADLSRSAAMVLPAALAGAVWVTRFQAVRLGRALHALVAASLMIPAAHVVATFTSYDTIYYLPAELDRFRRPPEYLNPEALHARAVQRVQRGAFDAAMVDLNLAIRLNPRLAIAYINRGALRSYRGDKTGALRDIETGLRLGGLDPKVVRQAEDLLRELRPAP